MEDFLRLVRNIAEGKILEVLNCVRKTKLTILRRINHSKNKAHRSLLKFVWWKNGKRRTTRISEQSSVQKVVKNPLVVKKILDHLDKKDLLQNSRRVNSLWHDLSTKILIQRRALQLQFWFTNGSYQKFNSILWDDRWSLSKLTHFLECSKNFDFIFPCVSFSFENGNLDGGGTFSHFFAAFGDQVKQLNLNFVEGSQQQFRKLIQEQAPNVESLQIEKFPSDWLAPSSVHEDKEYQGPKFSLPRLKSLEFGQPRQFSGIQAEILRAAVNLKCYDSLLTGNDSNLVEILMETDKIHTIQYLQFDPSRLNMEFYEKMSSLVPNLKKLSFSMRAVLRTPEIWPQVSSTFLKILKCSADSLEKISLSHPMPCLFRFEWPSLKKVREMEIAIYKTLNDNDSVESQSLQQQEWFGWSVTFPALRTLKLKPWVNQEKFWEKYLPFFGPALSVIRLRIYHPCPQFCLENLSEIFPNVRHLVMEGPMDFPKVGKSIWKMKRLQCLDMQLDIGYLHCDNVYPAVDATFTGFSQDTCRKLKNGDLLKDLDKLRVSPSILDLCELKRLNIGICYWTTNVDRTAHGLFHDRYNLITNVTGSHAFQQMQGLKVKISVVSFFHQNIQKINKSLASIAPYVTVDTFGLRSSSEFPCFDVLTQLLKDFGEFGAEQEILKCFYIALWLCFLFFILSIK